MSVPKEINVHKKTARLEVVFDDDARYELSAEYLRVFSPSAEVQGHSKDQFVLQHGKRNVQFLDFEPQGHYAIKITFSDGHDSGLFSWDYLRTLGENFDQNWAGYLEQLEAAGKSRDPQFIALDT
jgi:DUF971 family protein